MKIRIISIIGFLLCLTLTGLSQESKIEKCSVPKGTGGKYKLISEVVPPQSDYLQVDVIIKPKNFTKEYLTRLARRINAEYCNEDLILVAILESKESQRKWLHILLGSIGKIDIRRGVYSFERKSNHGFLEFLVKAGDAGSRVTIEIFEPKVKS